MVIFGGEEVSALVFDVGTENKRLGYAGQDAPIITQNIFDKSHDFNSKYSPFEAFEGFNDLSLSPTSHPLLMVDNSIYNPNTLIQEAFESLSLPAFYLAPAPVVAAFANNKSSCLVVDMGASHTTVTPVVDGHILKKAQVKSNIGGNFLSDQAFQYLNQELDRTILPRYMVQSRSCVDADLPPNFVRRDVIVDATFHELAIRVY